MKIIFKLFILLISLSSCVKYTQPKLLSLSSEYRVDKITYEQTDNSSSPQSMVFYPGDLYVNPNDISPFDSIPVGFFKLHMDYVQIRFSPNPMPWENSSRALPMSFCSKVLPSHVSQPPGGVGTWSINCSKNRLSF